MKLVNQAKKFESNNTELQSQNFGIGDASVVIEILRNRLYKHKIRTLVQEYIANGRDAMREVNSTQAIQVTIPTSLEPTFKVRDFGPGITPDRMATVFVMYGASTKRTSNLQNGGFGIGAKSAWAYTDSFTIVTYVDGTRRTYIAHTGANNNGRLDEIEIAPTKEPNGTEIQIAVAPKDVEQFKKAVLRATFFWPENSYKLLGISKSELRDKPESHIVLPNVETYDNGALEPVTGSYRNEHLMVIDGIPYVLTSEMLEKHGALQKLTKILRHELVFHVPNGFVEVSASREEISDSEFTNKAIAKLAKESLAIVDKRIKDQFSKAKTVQESLAVYMELSKEYNVEDYRNIGTYTIQHGKLQGGPLEYVTFERVTVDHNGKVSKDDIQGRSRRRSYSTKVNSIENNDFGKIFYADIEESPVAQNNRIREYFETNHGMLLVKKRTLATGTNSNVTQADFDKAFAQVLNDLSVKPISSITVTPKPKAVRVKIQRDKKQFCIHTFYNWRKDRVHTTLSDNTQKWLYVSLEQFSGNNSANLRELNEYLVEGGTGLKICGLGDDSIKRVQGDKNFKPLSDWLDAWTANDLAVRSYIKLNVAQNDSIVSRIAKIAGLKCKILNKAIKAYADYSGKVAPIPTMLVDKVKSHKEIVEFSQIDKELTKTLKDQYPLVLEVSSHKLQDELKWYINAKA
jgi:hypothetical protein